MKTAMTVVFAAGALLAGPVAVADPAALLQKGGCAACHSMDKKILGPAFKDVAAKYKGQDVEAVLIKKVKEGGSGVWGPMPMPPNAGKLADDEFKAVVEWVLAQ
ncbi:MAG TPA: c-type cytochrome [Novimethylophilus sp.]|jgi:cytochrome c|uniref:c-type cytochrome n=1 Tax=Novimethylophilus sp. TaxID=2137426 RepID=UPI002F41F3B8